MGKLNLIWRVLKKIIKHTLLTMLVLIIAGGIYYRDIVSNVIRWNPIATPLWVQLTGSTSENQIAARLADLDALEYYLELDRSFSTQQKNRFNQLLDKLVEEIEIISDATFIARIYELTTLSGNGHSGGSFRWLMSEIPQIPIQVYWFGSELRILRTHSQYQNILGGSILAIDGMPIEEVFQKLRPYLSGTENHERILSSIFLTRPYFLKGAGLAENEKRLSLTIQLDSANTIDTTLVAEFTPKIERAVRRYPFDYLIAEQLPEEENEWVTVLSSVAQKPTYLSIYNKLHHYEHLNDSSLYVRLRLCLSENGYNLREFWLRVEPELKKESITKIIFDYRNNPGGDLSLSRDFLFSLEDRIDSEKEIFILTDHTTFSAAIVGVAHIKGNSRLDVVQVGEEVGDTGDFWAETGLPFRLPNIGIRINYATGYHDWIKGCEGKPDCYSQDHKEVAIQSLAPDVPIPRSYQDYSNGVDASLNYVLNL